jgi:hypothetical protein
MLDLAFAAMSNSNDWCGYHRKVLSSESPQPKGKVPWLVVSTPLKNISQWEGLSNILWKIKNVWNHQPARIHLAVSEQDAYPQITILVGKWWLSIGLWLALFSDKTKPAVFFFQNSWWPIHLRVNSTTSVQRAGSGPCERCPENSKTNATGRRCGHFGEQKTFEM